MNRFDALVGTVWKPEDTFFGDLVYVVIDVATNDYLNHEVQVLDCQTGKLVIAYYDPDQKPSDPFWEVLICPLEKNGKPLGNHYLLPMERRT